MRARAPRSARRLVPSLLLVSCCLSWQLAAPAAAETGAVAVEENLRPHWIEPRRRIPGSGQGSGQSSERSSWQGSGQGSGRGNGQSSGQGNGQGNGQGVDASVAGAGDETGKERPDDEVGGATDTGTGTVPGSAARAGDERRNWRTEARVVVHGDGTRRRLTTMIVSLLEELGGDDVERRIVSDSVRLDQVRYFDVADAAMANEVATVLEPVFGELWVRDFTHRASVPESGLLELWLR